MKSYSENFAACCFLQRRPVFTSDGDCIIIRIVKFIFFFLTSFTNFDNDFRNRAITEGRIAKEREPFSVILKAFWDVSMAGQLLEEKFARTLHHEPDGLIFQPSKEVILF